jgi:hypothetical protein
MDIQADYSPTTETELCGIMKAVGSEIAGPMHNYTTLYSPIMEPVRNESLRLFHFGMRPSYDASGAIQTPAASLQGWRNYFPNAAIFGADDLSQNLTQIENIFTCEYTLADPSGLQILWEKEELKEEFDIIIDNGINHPHANAFCFEHSAHKVKVGGIYIIENIYWKTCTYWVNKRVSWERRFNNFKFRFMSIPHPTNKETNIVILAQKVAAEAKPPTEVNPESLGLQEYLDKQMEIAMQAKAKATVVETSAGGNQIVE